MRRLTTFYLAFLKGEVSPQVKLVTRFGGKNPTVQPWYLYTHLNTTKNDMGEDEKIKGESPHLAYACSHVQIFFFLFGRNSHL